MATKITVNGIAYNSVDAMPADVRQVCERSLAEIREVADREGTRAAVNLRVRIVGPPRVEGPES